MNMGDRFGKYLLLECLGKGGQAEVWKAQDTNLERYVAMKFLKNPLGDDERERFKREAKSLASLQNPHIVQVLDYDAGPAPYIVMQYVEGKTLKEYIDRTSRKREYPSYQDIHYLFSAIGLAVEAAHRKDIIHRDIKPSNILLDRHDTLHNAMGKPVLSDFGLAKLLNATALTISGQGLGTLYYSAPEQLIGKSSKRSDIYSLGVILFEFCTGEQPFQIKDIFKEGNVFMQVYWMQMANVFRPPSQINRNITPDLEEVIKMAMEGEPDKRYSSAFAMVEALSEALEFHIPEYLILPDDPPSVIEQSTPPSLSGRTEDEYLSNWQTPGPDLDSRLDKETSDVRGSIAGLKAQPYMPPVSQTLRPDRPPEQTPPVPPKQVVNPSPKKIKPEPVAGNGRQPRRLTFTWKGLLVLAALVIICSVILIVMHDITSKAVTPPASPTVGSTVVPGAGPTFHFGPLNTNFFLMVEEIQKYAVTDQDHAGSQADLELREYVVNILYYLDGQCTHQEDLANLPVNIAPQAHPDVSSIANTKVGLLDCNQPTQSLGYLTQLATALYTKSSAPGATAEQKKLAGQITSDICNYSSNARSCTNSTNVNEWFWLSNVKSDAKQLLIMPTLQNQPKAQTLFEDMAAEADYAFGGEVDSSGNLYPGAQEIDGYIQRLSNL